MGLSSSSSSSPSSTSPSSSPSSSPSESRHGGTGKKDVPWQIEIDADSFFRGSNFSVANQAAFLWPGGLTLCQYLCSPATVEDAKLLLGCFPLDTTSITITTTTTVGSLVLEGRSVLELGAGVGLSSVLIAGAFPPRRFLATEMDEAALVHLKRNLEKNQVAFNAQVLPLDWRELYPSEASRDTCLHHHSLRLNGSSLQGSSGSSLQGLNGSSSAGQTVNTSDGAGDGRFDVVLGADLIWDEDTAELAIHAARCLTRRSFLLVMVHRSDYMKSFVEETLTKYGFTYQCRSWPVPQGSQACFVYLCCLPA